MAVSSLGCPVCEGGVAGDNGRPLALSLTSVPSRRDGWQCAPPLSKAAMDAAAR